VFQPIKSPKKVGERREKKSNMVSPGADAVFESANYSQFY